MRQYWDANLFLLRLNDHVQSAPTIDYLFGLAQSGAHPILTSEISVVEVAYVAREQIEPAIRGDTLAAIDALLFDSQGVELIPIDTELLREARDLAREAAFDSARRGLQAADAIHLAAALRGRADVFFTFDTRLLDAEAVRGLPLKEPTLGWP